MKNSYNGIKLSIKVSALNIFKPPLEVCTVAGGLNRKLISHLTFHSIKYACAHLDKNNIFSCYMLQVDKHNSCQNVSLSWNHSKNVSCFVSCELILDFVQCGILQLMHIFLHTVNSISMVILRGQRITCHRQDLTRSDLHFIKKVGLVKKERNIIS